MKLRDAKNRALLLLAIVSAGLSSACWSTPSPKSIRALSRVEAGETAPVAKRETRQEILEERSNELVSVPAPATESYRLGPGDGLRVDVVGRPELSGTHTVGPDGSVALPLAGTLELHGLTREAASAEIAETLAPFFRHPPRVNVDVTDYQNNKAYVLGRVEQPGVVDLTGAGNLLQALARAGGLPVREFRSFLAKCAIIRGQDEILWIDLIDLLQGGNLALNVPLRNGDVVFIPDSEDAMVFVMGEVRTPGAVPIKVRIDLVQALAQAGGPTEHADLTSVYVVRSQGPDGFEEPLRVDFEYLVETGDFSENLELRTGDILYVARSGMGDVNYVFRSLQPALWSLTLGAAIQ